MAGLLVGLATLFWTKSVQAQTVWYVDTDAAGVNTGTSWTDAFSDLQDALALAQDGHEIWVAEGLYTPTPDGDRTVSFILPSGVELYGGFNGTEENRDERDWTLHESILSGDVGVPGDSLDNSLHVVRVVDAIPNTILDGLIIQHGYADGVTSPDYLGGGLYVLRGASTLRNSTIRYNATRRNGTPDGGGGVYAENADLMIEDVMFERNVAQDFGGSIYVVGGNAHFARVTARRDSALTGSSFYFYGSTVDLSTCLITEAYSRGGGAMHLNSTVATVSDCLIENTAGVGLIVFGSSPRFKRLTVRGNVLQGADGGGALIGEASSVVFEDALFENNQAVGGSALQLDGNSSALFLRTTFRDNLAEGSAALRLGNSSATLIGCRFERNRGLGTGGLLALGSAVTVLQSVFVGNTSTWSEGAGGGLLVTGGTFTGEPILVANSLFAGNEASEGGAVAAFGVSAGEAHIINTTFAENRGRATGGALYAQDAGGLVVQNSILYGNTAPDGPEVFTNSGAPPMIVQSIVAGGYPSGSGILDADPLFIRDPHPGPDGTWGSDDDDYGDLRLSEGSPAVDYGLAQYLPPDTWDLDGDGDTGEPLPVDLDGGARVLGASPDLGAYEGPVGVATEPVSGGHPGPDPQLTVYPNPSGGVLHIERPNVQFQDGEAVVVMDVLGRTVIRQEITSPRTVMDVSRLPSGVYMVRAGDQQVVVTVRR